MIHWTWIIFSVIVLGLIVRIWFVSDSGGVVPDLEAPLLTILLVAFVLIWGGVFWW